jgi:predicted metalloprotease
LESGGGPAYCPFNRTIYIDLPLMRAVEPFRDPFLMRVIIAHEWAHHIQRVTGYQEAAYPDGSGEVFSVQMELHADCLAGVWAQHAVDAGDATDDDIRRAVTLAFLSGDLPGSPLRGPDAHGSGEMRVDAFLSGFEGGTVANCEEALLQPR